MWQGPKSWISKLKATRLIIAERLELKAEKITAAAATVVSVTVPLTIIDSSLGTMANLVLADGYHGQVKHIIMSGNGGDATVTPTHLGDYAGGAVTTIVLDDVGDGWTGIFYGTQWWTVGTPKATVA